jgi:hypothetical protein
MPTNVFFNNFQASQEQLLIEDLVIESIKIYGHDTFYCPRTLVNKDEIYGEDSISRYDTQYMVEMYIKNVMGFQGEGDFMSKFNLQIRDQMTLTIARRTFFDEIGNVESLDRPQEGDLIYFPLNKKIFVVKFVEHEAIFYQLGALQTYDLQCELWEYSNEILNTGIEDIDKLQKEYSFDMSVYGLKTEDNYVIKDEDEYDIIQEQYNFSSQIGDSLEDNEEIESEADNILDFSERDPFSEGAY